MTHTAYVERQAGQDPAIPALIYGQRAVCNACPGIDEPFTLLHGWMADDAHWERDGMAYFHALIDARLHDLAEHSAVLSVP